MSRKSSTLGLVESFSDYVHLVDRHATTQLEFDEATVERYWRFEGDVDSSAFERLRNAKAEIVETP